MRRFTPPDTLVGAGAIMTTGAAPHPPVTSTVRLVGEVDGKCGQSKSEEEHPGTESEITRPNMCAQRAEEIQDQTGSRERTHDRHDEPGQQAERARAQEDSQWSYHDRGIRLRFASVFGYSWPITFAMAVAPLRAEASRVTVR